MEDSDLPGNGERWITPQEVADHYGISSTRLRQLTARGAWPCHRYGRLARFSPDDVEVIEARWEEHQGEDPPVLAPSWREVAMQDNLTSEERDAVKRGYEASEYLRSLDR